VELFGIVTTRFTFSSQLNDFLKTFPGDLSLGVKNTLEGSKSLDDIGELMDLITDNRRVLRQMKDGTTQDISEVTRKMAFHLLKMSRVLEEIKFVWKKVQLHKQDQSLKSLQKQYMFVSLNCHAELAILKTANDCCQSKTLYIGVSKRPCYCC
jgi:hypothetical protein